MDKEKKLTVALIVATFIIIIGGAFLLTKPAKVKPEPTVSTDILIRSDSQKLTAPKEKVVMVEFGDFQCPACSAYHKVVKELLTENKDTLSLVFRNFPLSQHKNARVSAYAAEAAGLQGKYWEMYDKLYENQKDWSDKSDALSIFEGYAKEMGLDLTKFKSDASSSAIKTKVDRDYADGIALNVDSTPTFYINSQKVKNPGSLEDFKTLVKAAELNVSTNITDTEKYHAHFDLVVMVNGKAIDFSLPKYQSTSEIALDPDVHVHDGNGEIVHVHKKGVTLGQFFKSLKLSVTGSLYVNGVKKDTSDILSYEPNDLDRVLITSETRENVLKTQVESVTDKACIYSEKCPERGKAPTEECVGGIGSDCEKE